MERSAVAQPDAVAVSSRTGALTYRQLNDQADRLARLLRRSGVGPEVRVGVCLRPGPGMVVGLLAVLKAGGAYVPLDPYYPAQRLAWVVADARAVVTITDSHTYAALPTDDSMQRICLDRLDGADFEAQYDHQEPVAQLAPDNLAYIMYTSGSSGTPKGVEVTHRNLSNYLRWADQEYPTGGRNVAVLHSSISFDLTVTALYLPLIRGMLIEIPDNDGPASGASSLETHLLARPKGIGLLKATPAHVEMLCRALESAGITLDVGSIVIGGEAFSWDLADLVRRTCGSATVIVNEYGPTETTVGCTTYKVTDAVSSDHGPTVPIGRPIANMEVFVVDEVGGLVPVGVPGEVLIGGAGVARGYGNRPGLTALRFVPHPFSDVPGARLYRSGDVARWRADGELEFLGRLDDQVKIRGFRIEPGEIEAMLRQLPGIGEAVVVARQDRPGDKRLVAYLTADGPRPSVTAVRGWLRQRLSEYMIPAAFVFLDALPLNHNGKVDRGALPVPESGRPDLEAGYVPPETPTEWAIAAIWVEVLGVDPIGRHDNFFELGGHSLLAIQAVSRLSQDRGKDISVRLMFTAPTVERLARDLDAMRAPATPPVVLARRAGDRAPLSFAQQRMWFLDQLQPGGIEYLVPMLLCLRGVLDVPALRNAWAALCTRHEVLRTVIEHVGGKPVQVVRPASIVDLRILDAAEHSGESALDMAKREAIRPIDLTLAPVRAVLIRANDQDEHLLVLTVHHIAFDGWSAEVLTRDLSEFYAAAVEERPASLPELRIQYADFAEFQRDRIRGDLLDRQLDYWRQALDGLSALKLPVDRMRSAVRSAEGRIHRITAPPDVTAALRQTARRHDVTSFVVLLAVFQTMLCRLSGQTDVAVGTPITGRDRPETEDLLGLFVNTLVMRADLSGDPTFEQVLAQVRQSTLDAFEHRDVPFERLVEVLAPVRDLARTPLVQTMFVLQSGRGEAWKPPGVEVEVVALDYAPAKFDLTMTVSEADTCLNIELCFAVDLFEDATVQRIAEHFLTLLAAVTEDPTVHVKRVSLLSDDERHHIAARNDTVTDYPQDVGVHQLVEHWAAVRPESVAVVYGTETLTYGQLNQRANKLAHHLRELGVGPGVHVGVNSRPSSDMIVALLGVLKAGGTYVPLDPDYPDDRLAMIIADTGLRVVVTEGAPAAALPAGLGVRQVRLDPSESASRPATNPVPLGSGDQLAYVIYTSGSTGAPKGVQITHQNLVNLIWTSRQEFQFDADDAWVLFHSFAFDFSVWEIWGSLCHGGRLIVLDRATTRDPLALLDALIEQKVTVFNQTPSAFETFQRVAVRSPAAGALSLRLVIFGGEALDPSALAEWRGAAHLPQPRLVNMYGITETTVHVTARDLTIDDITAGGGKSPIGRPIANMEVFVVDEVGGLVPVGVPGEVLIGGAGVARGYGNRPGLTALRFVPHPFSDVPGARLYRSGDVARWRADGELEFLGRLDDQVKIRGFRIEPGEIEAMLRQLPGIGEAVVVARQDRPGDKRLVAYLTADGPRPSVTAVRGWLRQRLSEYMIPAAFVFLDALPLNHNGKVDRGALPVPESGRPDLEAGYVPPETPTEWAIAAIWVEVLGVDPIGRHDNFFELGGDSLLSLQVIAKAREAGIQLTPRMLFQHQTLATVAEGQHSKERQPCDSGPGLVELNRSGASRTMFWHHEIGGAVTGYLTLARALSNDTRMVGVESAALPTAGSDLTAMAYEYADAMRCLDPQGPYLLGGWSIGGVIAFEVARALQEMGARVAALFLLDSALPIGEPAQKYLANESMLSTLIARITSGDWETTSRSPEFIRAMAELALPDELRLLGAAEMHRRLEVMRAHCRAVVNYRPSRIDCEAVLYRARESAWQGAAEDTWVPFVERLTVRTVPGDHHSILRHPDVETLAGLIMADVARLLPNAEV
ncbi:amino acid adenylation domain-containing protein [Micromonospora sp. NPDC051196]|uniref:amino acid adenylation domain-containing protein n=1 Tax=Micromonospora sp. NPDC051196 TaxID=3155281 RepID=UPI003414966C